MIDTKKTIAVYIVNTDPKKYNKYGITNKNSPKNGIFPSNPKIPAMMKRKTKINTKETEVYTTECQCLFT